MRYLYSAFLRPKQSRSATEWHVLTGSHFRQFLPVTHTTILTLLRKHSPDGTTGTRQHTSDITYHLIYRPRTDERLSWPSWLAYSGRFTDISGHPSAAGRAWDRESSPVKDQRSTAVQRNQHVFARCECDVMRCAAGVHRKRRLPVVFVSALRDVDRRDSRRQHHCPSHHHRRHPHHRCRVDREISTAREEASQQPGDGRDDRQPGLPRHTVWRGRGPGWQWLQQTPAQRHVTFLHAPHTRTRRALVILLLRPVNTSNNVEATLSNAIQVEWFFSQSRTLLRHCCRWQRCRTSFS